ncbi:MAG: hypothetical protein IPI11_17980 [Haliscomenobacter sp.]|nr:hypothetical protein [Haliscomenobacter sp.]
MSNRLSFLIFPLWTLLLLSLASCSDGQRLAQLKRKSVQVLQLPSPVVPEWEEDLLPEDLEAFQESLQSFAAALTAIDPLSLSSAQKKTYVQLKKALEETIRQTAPCAKTPPGTTFRGGGKPCYPTPNFPTRKSGNSLKSNCPKPALTISAPGRS